MRRSRTAPSAPSFLSAARNAREENAHRTRRDSCRSRTRDSRRESSTDHNRCKARATYRPAADCGRRPRYWAILVQRCPNRRRRCGGAASFRGHCTEIASFPSSRRKSQSREVFVKKAMVVLAVFAAICGGCKGREDATTSSTTETIAPAQPKPASASDTDAMTQTVDVEDGRSEDEGAGLNNTTTAKTGTTGTTGTTENPTTTVPPPPPPPTTTTRH